jgi:GTPase SAR1 family protein
MITAVTTKCGGGKVERVFYQCLLFPFLLICFSWCDFWNVPQLSSNPVLNGYQVVKITHIATPNTLVQQPQFLLHPQMASTPTIEYNFCILGANEVGKSSIVQKLCGQEFNRKNKYKSSTEPEATKYTVEVASSAGVILFNIYDWAWEAKRAVENINPQLAKGRDGGIFVYDCTDRRTHRDFAEYADWYSRAAGFDKPWLIISNKNDQKKKAVQDTEGEALARAGDRRGFAAVSLVDNTGIDDVVLTLARIMTGDLNLTVSSYGAASLASLQWSADRSEQSSARIGLSLTDLPSVKTHRVLIVVMNSSVVEKFKENFSLSEYVAEGVGSADQCVSEIETPEDPASLPVVAIVAPPSASEGQKKKLAEVAQSHNLRFVVSVPRSALETVRAAIVECEGARKASGEEEGEEKK